jgi:hypothetical protein
MSVQQVAVAVTVLLNFAAAICWMISANAKVLTQTPGGYGAMLGGELVVRGTNGERLNFLDTYVVQSKCNARAAILTGAGAAAAAVSLILSRC